MKNRILVLSTYPAPYRLQLFEMFKGEFKIDVFFNSVRGDERNNDWFGKGEFYTLDSEVGRKEYQKKIKKLRTYDLVAIYDYTSLKAAGLIVWCRILKVPYVVNCDGVILTEHNKWYKEILKRFLLGQASAYLASGEYAKKYFLKYGADESKIYLHTFTTLKKGDIISAPIDAKMKGELRRKLNLPEEAKLAIAVGRFIPLKRYDELIRAWKPMPDNYYLLLIGGGTEQDRYKRTVQELQLSNIIIEPFHPMRELFEYYKASDVFVHPTSYDVWGLVVNEAMACGLPVVVSDKCVAGLELVEQGINGFVVSMGDETMIVDRTRYIFENEDVSKKMSKKCLKTIRPYTIDNMAKTHVEIFRELINNYGKNNSECRRFRP